MSTADPSSGSKARASRCGSPAAGSSRGRRHAAEHWGAFLMFEDRMERGKVTPLHHPAEAIYVLDGEIIAHVGTMPSIPRRAGAVLRTARRSRRVHGVVGDRAQPACRRRNGGILLLRGASRPRQRGVPAAPAARSRRALELHRNPRSAPVRTAAGPATRGAEVFGLSPPALSGSRSARRELALAHRVYASDSCCARSLIAFSCARSPLYRSLAPVAARRSALLDAAAGEERLKRA